MFPVRCYTCNCVVGDRHERFERMQYDDRESVVSIFRALGIERMCCRRMFLGYTNITKDLIQFPNVDTVLDEGGTTLRRRVTQTRTVSCA